MPALPRQSVRGRAGDITFGFTVDASVGVDGLFSVEVPFVPDNAPKAYVPGPVDCPAVAFEVYQKEREARPRRFPSVQGFRQQPNLRVLATDLQHALGFVAECARVSLLAARKVDLVIAYRARSKAAAWMKGGKLFPNGAVEGAEGGEWWRPKNPRTIASHDSVSSFDETAIGLRAVVLRRVTVERETGSTVIMSRPTDEDAVGEFGKLLNGWLAGRWGEGEFDGFEFMPYSEEAARFFHLTTAELARMAVRLDEFFGDPVRVREIAEGGRALRLSGPPGSA